MVGLGQLLNSSTFRAIGAKGVYYGSQLGYDVSEPCGLLKRESARPWATGFPYNIGISDPQRHGSLIKHIMIVRKYVIYT